MRFVLLICFYIPLVTNLLNVQVFITKFISTSYSQIFAYISMALLLLGTLLVFKKRQQFSLIIKMWVTFYLLYYTFGILANIHLGTQPEILRTLVPIVFFISFSFLLSIPKYRKPVGKLLAWSFFTSVVLLIIMDYYNFSLDSGGIYEYMLNRAGGVYGDANNASAASILSFIFVSYYIAPKNKIQKILKILVLAVSVYGIVLTFSKTGFLVFLIALGIVNHKFFTGKRILISIIVIPIALISLIGWATTTETLSLEQKQRVESVVNILTLNVDQVGFSERDMLFKRLLSFVFENPFMGNGINFAASISGHNTIVGVWADSGILTFIMFLVLLLTYFKKSLFATNGTTYFALSSVLTLTFFMLTLQTVINQGYLIVVFVLIGYVLNDPRGLRLGQKSHSNEQLQI